MEAEEIGGGGDEDDYEPDISTSAAASPNLSSLSSTDLLITESPTMQVMDRSMDTSHRIPSSVFELDHSSDPIQWSTASSESLFSIHLGNTSISGDYGLRCSDERGTTGEASIDRPVPTRQVSDRPSVKLRAVEASLEEEGSRESEDHNHEKSFAEGRGSNASVKSFAFPMRRFYGEAWLLCQIPRTTASTIADAGDRTIATIRTRGCSKEMVFLLPLLPIGKFISPEFYPPSLPK
nr:uncharacterized protein LOC109162770 [Ipomoea trifida]